MNAVANRSTHPRRRLCAAAVILLLVAPLSAHDVVVEQVVEMTLQPHGDHLAVTLHVPATASGDRDLPAVLAGQDAAAIEARVRIVAADLAHNLDVEQGDTSLAPQAIVARPGVDGASLDIDLRYPTVNDGPYSARMNAFTATTIAPVRTNARFHAAGGRIDLISVVGAPVRVVFDPPVTLALRQFAGRGLRALVNGGDHLLWLICALLLVRRARPVLALFAAVAASQTVAILASSVVPAVLAPWAPVAGVIAASAVAITAMQNVAAARLRLVVAVGVLFGVMNGLTFGDTVASAAPFAGGHRWMAVAVFTAVVVAGELWLGTLGWMVRRWIDERGLPERGVAILGSAFIAHEALHRAVSRADAFAQGGSFGGDQAIEWITLAWAGAVLLVGVANAMTGAPEEAPAS